MRVCRLLFVIPVLIDVNEAFTGPPGDGRRIGDWSATSNQNAQTSSKISLQSYHLSSVKAEINSTSKAGLLRL